MAILLTSSMTSCVTYKHVPYFQDVPDSTRLSVARAQYHALRIEKGDLLTVNIQTIDPEANAIFSQMPSSAMSPAVSSSIPSAPGGGTTPMLVAPSPSGVQVYDDGTITIPLIGKVPVLGMTTEDAADTIQARVAVLYKQPTVTVRFANLKITILGEVLKPGSYIMPNEKNSIFDALGMAGDLTIYGKRENVLLIRDSAGKSNFIRFNLNSKDLVSSDYFYLRQNDVLYITPSKGRSAANDANQARIFAIAASILSVIIVLASRIN